MSLQQKLSELSEEGYLTVYLIDTQTSEYEEVMSIGHWQFKEQDPAGTFFTAMDFTKDMAKHFNPGTYFCVYRNAFGVDWWAQTVLTEEEKEGDEKEKTEKKRVERRRLRKKRIVEWFKGHADTIIIIAVVMCMAILTKI